MITCAGVQMFCATYQSSNVVNGPAESVLLLQKQRHGQVSYQKSSFQETSPIDLCIILLRHEFYGMVLYVLVQYSTCTSHPSINVHTVQ